MNNPLLQSLYGGMGSAGGYLNDYMRLMQQPDAMQQPMVNAYMGNLMGQMMTPDTANGTMQPGEQFPGRRKPQRPQLPQFGTQPAPNLGAGPSAPLGLRLGGGY